MPAVQLLLVIIVCAPVRVATKRNVTLALSLAMTKSQFDAFRVSWASAAGVSASDVTLWAKTFCPVMEAQRGTERLRGTKRRRDGESE